MIKKHFPVILEQDKGGVFIASCPIFKGCHTYGYTIDEAVTNITEAIEVWLEDSAEDMKIQFVGVRDVEIALWSPLHQLHSEI